MTNKTIAVVVGSIRKEAFSRRTAEALMALAPEGLKLEIAEIRQLGFYNQDLDANPPAEWVQFKQRIASAAGVIFVTPEYNRSVPGVLKNAIDIASRPYGKSAWDGKPAGIISTTPGGLGAFGANHHLRQSLTFLNMPVLQQPEAYLSHVGKKFGSDGKVSDDDFKGFLVKFLEAYAAHVGKYSS